MSVTLLSVIKKALQSGDLLHEFDYWLSTYTDDFVLTPEELGKCWHYLSESVDAPKELFITLGEIFYREAVLRNIWKDDREFWRKLTEYDEDEILQKTMLIHYIANKPPNYVSEARRRIQTIGNAIAMMMANFMNPPEEPWISLNERFGTIRIKFLKALDRAQEVLDEERGTQNGKGAA